MAHLKNHYLGYLGVWPSKDHHDPGNQLQTKANKYKYKKQFSKESKVRFSHVDDRKHSIWKLLSIEFVWLICDTRDGQRTTAVFANLKKNPKAF